MGEINYYVNLGKMIEKQFPLTFQSIYKLVNPPIVYPLKTFYILIFLKDNERFRISISFTKDTIVIESDEKDELKKEELKNYIVEQLKFDNKFRLKFVVGDLKIQEK